MKILYLQYIYQLTFRGIISFASKMCCLITKAKLLKLTKLYKWKYRRDWKSIICIIFSKEDIREQLIYERIISNKRKFSVAFHRYYPSLYNSLKDGTHPHNSGEKIMNVTLVDYIGPVRQKVKLHSGCSLTPRRPTVSSGRNSSGHRYIINTSVLCYIAGHRLLMGELINY